MRPYLTIFAFIVACGPKDGNPVGESTGDPGDTTSASNSSTLEPTSDPSMPTTVTMTDPSSPTSFTTQPPTSEPTTTFPGTVSTVTTEPPGTATDDTSFTATDGTTETTAFTSGTMPGTSDTLDTEGRCTDQFLADPDCPDIGMPGIECDPWSQDCPQGQKCSAWADNGGSSWNATKCVPLDPNPAQPGDVCTVEGSAVSGIDTCDKAVMCFFVDPDTNMGTCVPLCSGTLDAPVCLDPDAVCVITNEGVLNLCLDSCDPAAPDSCPDGQTCQPVGNSSVCIPA